jgi:hypothetical protein
MPGFDDSSGTSRNKFKYKRINKFQIELKYLPKRYFNLKGFLTIVLLRVSPKLKHLICLLSTILTN